MGSVTENILILCVYVCVIEKEKYLPLMFLINVDRLWLKKKKKRKDVG